MPNKTERVQQYGGGKYCPLNGIVIFGVVCISRISFSLPGLSSSVNYRTLSDCLGLVSLLICHTKSCPMFVAI